MSRSAAGLEQCRSTGDMRAIVTELTKVKVVTVVTVVTVMKKVTVIRVMEVEKSVEEQQRL